MPTHKYINYVVQKNMNLWENNQKEGNPISDQEGHESKQSFLKKKPCQQKPNIFLRFCCCFDKFLDDKEEVFLILIY